MMATDDQLEQLSRRLSWQSPGPIDAALADIMSMMGTAGSNLLSGIRWATAERPLITLLLCWQVGYLAGRMGRRYARH